MLTHIYVLVNLAVEVNGSGIVCDSGVAVRIGGEGDRVARDVRVVDGGAEGDRRRAVGIEMEGVCGRWRGSRVVQDGRRVVRHGDVHRELCTGSLSGVGVVRGRRRGGRDRGGVRGLGIAVGVHGG